MDCLLASCSWLICCLFVLCLFFCCVLVSFDVDVVVVLNLGVLRWQSMQNDSMRLWKWRRVW